MNEMRENRKKLLRGLAQQLRDYLPGEPTLHIVEWAADVVEIGDKCISELKAELAALKDENEKLKKELCGWVASCEKLNRDLIVMVERYEHQ